MTNSMEDGEVALVQGFSPGSSIVLGTWTTNCDGCSKAQELQTRRGVREELSLNYR